MRVGDLNWMQLEAYLGGDDRIVFPVGSTEQHAFLSLETDNILAERTSTLDGRNVLPHRIRWIGRPNLPAAEVSKVEFLIDGTVRWIERNPPYTYGDDTNWLVTSWLSPGRHRFAVRVKAKDGRTALRTTVARVVPAPAPPAELSGSWKHSFGAGIWVLTVDKAGWKILDPFGIPTSSTSPTSRAGDSRREAESSRS